VTEPQVPDQPTPATPPSPPGPPDDIPDVAFALSDVDVQRLAVYNAECARGIVHTVEWDARMASLQRRYDRLLRLGEQPL
jgi:hypothetical protein